MKTRAFHQQSHLPYPTRVHDALPSLAAVGELMKRKKKKKNAKKESVFQDAEDHTPAPEVMERQVLSGDTPDQVRKRQLGSLS